MGISRSAGVGLTDLMEIVDCEDDLCDVELRYRLIEDTVGLNDRTEITSDEILHDETDVGLVSERINCLHNEVALHSR